MNKEINWKLTRRELIIKSTGLAFTLLIVPSNGEANPLLWIAGRWVIGNIFRFMAKEGAKKAITNSAKSIVKKSNKVTIKKKSNNSDLMMEINRISDITEAASEVWRQAGDTGNERIALVLDNPSDHDIEIKESITVLAENVAGSDEFAVVKVAPSRVPKQSTIIIQARVEKMKKPGVFTLKGSAAARYKTIDGEYKEKRIRPIGSHKIHVASSEDWSNGINSASKLYEKYVNTSWRSIPDNEPETECRGRASGLYKKTLGSCPATS